MDALSCAASSESLESKRGPRMAPSSLPAAARQRNHRYPLSASTIKHELLGGVWMFRDYEARFCLLLASSSSAKKRVEVSTPLSSDSKISGTRPAASVRSTS